MAPLETTALVFAAASWILCGMALIGFWRSAHVLVKRVEFGFLFCLAVCKGLYLKMFIVETLSQTSWGSNEFETGEKSVFDTRIDRIWSDVSIWLGFPVIILWTFALGYSATVKSALMRDEANRVILRSTMIPMIILGVVVIADIVMRVHGFNQSLQTQDEIFLSFVLFTLVCIGVYICWSFYHIVRKSDPSVPRTNPAMAATTTTTTTAWGAPVCCSCAGLRAVHSKFGFILIFIVTYVAAVTSGTVLFISSIVLQWPTSITIMFCHAAQTASLFIVTIVELRITLQSGVTVALDKERSRQHRENSHSSITSSRLRARPTRHSAHFNVGLTTIVAVSPPARIDVESGPGAHAFPVDSARATNESNGALQLAGLKASPPATSRRIHVHSGSLSVSPIANDIIIRSNRNIVTTIITAT
jgi:hypothetical protein